MDATVVIDGAVLIGAAFVFPLALGRPRWTTVAAVAVGTALLLPIGPAGAAVASVWLLVALALFVDGADRVASGFGVVAAAAFTSSRGGLELFGIGEPIVELTAVHFTYAGVGGITLARLLDDHRPRLRTSALGLTVLAPPVVALGFVTHHPIPQVGGAILMSVAVLLTATGELGDAMATPPARRWPRALLAISAVAPWIPMGLAVAWAASNYWAVPAMSIPDMARTHGVMNMVFVLAGLTARRVAPTLGHTSLDKTLAQTEPRVLHPDEPVVLR